jgi:hypothetical protein
VVVSGTWEKPSAPPFPEPVVVVVWLEDELGV